jgi:ketosteroid isomerase-like protein
MYFRNSLLVCALLTASAVSASAPHPSDAAQQILAAEAAELAAWEAEDIEAIMNAYAEDAVVMPGGAVIPDRRSLRELFVAFLEDPGFTLTFRSDPPLVAASGEIGVTVGTYAVSFTHPESREVVRHTGRHLMTWRLESDGEWRVIRQMTAHDRQN